MEERQQSLFSVPALSPNVAEESYWLLFGQHPEPMFVFDADTKRFLAVNPAALRQYGYSRQEFLALSLKDIRPEEDWPLLEAYLNQNLSYPSPSPALRFGGRWRHRKKDGELMEVHVSWSPIIFQGRKAALCLVDDVTERHRLERRNAIFAQTDKGLGVATSQTGVAEIMADALETLLGWAEFYFVLAAEREASPRVLLHLRAGIAGHIESIDPAAEQSLEEFYSACLTQPSLPSQPAIASAGIIWMWLGAKTPPINIVGILPKQPLTRDHVRDFRDLTVHCLGALERIKAQEALSHSETLYHSLVKSLPQAIFRKDAHGRFTFANERFCQAVGKTQLEILGKTDFDFFPAALANKYREDDRRVIETGQILEDVEENWPLQGRKTYVQFVKIPLFDSRKQVVGIQGLFWDISDKLTLEAQLRQAQKMESIGQLAGGVAHDFNNLLTVIQGHAALLMNGQLEPEALDSAQQISLAAERAANLTRQLLTFSRRQLIQPKQLDLNETVTTLSKMLRRLLREDIFLQLDCATALPAIKADRGMIEQVIVNLAVNARDAMPNGGKLLIQTRLITIDTAYLRRSSEAKVGSYVCLIVVDTGSGIAPEHLPRLFEPFFTTKEVGQGSGLGLATVYGIIKLHQGWIEVESELERGTTFRLFFPSTAPAPPEPLAARQAPQLPGGTETILVVEDELAVRTLVRNILGKLGYTVLEAPNGKAALILWPNCRDKVDLLLTDVVMPDGMSGSDLARQLARDKPSLKIIFTSGYGAETLGKDGILHEGMNFLQKPYYPSKLARVVRDCLDHKSPANGNGSRTNNCE